MRLSKEIEFSNEANMQDLLDDMKGDLMYENNLLAPPLRLMKVEFTFVDDLGNEVRDAFVHEEFNQQEDDN